MIKGVFFDLGGTLFHYDRGNREMGMRLVNAMLKLPGADGLNPRDIGSSYGRANQAIAKQYAKLDYYLHADLFRDTFKHACTSLGLVFDAAVYGEFEAEQHDAIVGGLSLRDDCMSTLQALKTRGLYLSILSNIDENMLQPLVKRESLDNVLDHWTSSEAAQSCKPHAACFDLSLEKAGLAADEVLFVGDSPEHDINGALAVGMQAALINNGQPAPLQSGAATVAPSHTIETLAELTELV